MNSATITASTKALYATAMQLDKAGLTADERTVKQWAIKAIEARVPAVEAHMEAWADSETRTSTYIQALGTALRTVGAL